VTEQEHLVAPSVLLDRLAEEVGCLAGTAARAEVGLQALLDRVSGLPPGAAADLQRIDYLRQSLEDIARLLWVAAAAASPPPKEVIPCDLIREATVLSDLRARLVTDLGDAAAESEAEAPLDDLHLF
jgi:hypothetical protein